MTGRTVAGDRHDDTPKMLTALPDGTRFVVRPIRADDKPRLERAYSQLSDESVRRRFLGSRSGLSRSELRYLTEVDGHDHVALAAFRADDPETLVAVARFVRLASDPTTAEAAVVVCDQYQGRGLGTRLGALLAGEARARGIGRFSATIQSDNVPAQRLMQSISGRLSRGPHESGAQELVAELAA